MQADGEKQLGKLLLFFAEKKDFICHMANKKITGKLVEGKGLI